MSKIAKIFKTVLATAWCYFALMGASTSALGVNAFHSGEKLAQVKSVVFKQPQAANISVPLQIFPVQVDAPPRRIDLLPGRANKINAQYTDYPLSGLPADLYEYPILNFRARDSGSAFWGVDLTLASHAKGAPNTLVHIGEPTLFPDMVDTRIDFHSVEFAPKGRVYALKRKIGLGGDEKWRYTPQNVTVEGITNGIVSASFAPGGAMVLTRAFDSLDIEKAPWLNFEYTLPKDSSWTVHINAKIAIDGLKRDVTLFPQPIKGGGKKKILLNLAELLHGANPLAKGGRLKDLVIHFTLDRSSDAAEGVRIDLGQLEFYRVRQQAQSDMPYRLLLVPDYSKPIDLVAMLDRLDFVGGLAVLRGSLISSAQDTEIKVDALPKLNLQASYREKIPKLFVGEAFYLDDLNGSELSAVLDQKLFLEKNILWQTGLSEVVTLKQDSSVDSVVLSHPLISYSPDIDVGDAAYILVDYEFGSGDIFPVYLTLSGMDRQGKGGSFDRLISNNKPIKISNFNLRKMNFSFKQAGSDSPIPTSFRVKKIQISKMQKTHDFLPKKSTTVISFEVAKAKAKAILKAAPERIDFAILGHKEMQTIKSFAVNHKVVGKTSVHFDLEPSGVEPWFLRVKGENRGVRVEQLFPISRRGSLALPEIDLQGLDLIVNGGDNTGHGQIQIHQMEIRIDKVAEVRPPEVVIWSAPSRQHESSLRGSAALQTAMSFNVDKKIPDGAVMDYELTLSSGPALSYLLRVKGDSALGYSEQLIPLALSGTLALSVVKLHGLELVVHGGDIALLSTVRLNRFVVKEGEVRTVQKIFNMDSSLTYEEIMKGSKLIKLPLTFIDQGALRIDYTMSDDFALNVDTDYIKANQPQAVTQPTESLPKTSALKILFYVGMLVVAVILYISVSRFLPRWLPAETHPHLYGAAFWVAELALLGVAYYMAFKSESKDGFSWSGVILVLAYGSAMRWKIRPLLARKWNYFAERYSAPYFILFLVLLLSCAILLVFKMEAVAEKVAVICYFLLVTGVVVEFIQFSRESRISKADSDS